MSSSTKKSDQRNNVKAEGSLPFLHPTHTESEGKIWRSRANRKGRHPIQQSQHDTTTTPPRTNTFRQVMAGVGRMATQWPYWDISWLVATIGSVVWCINGFFAWLPLQLPNTEFEGEKDGAAMTAFIGATIFEFASMGFVLEAYNANRESCFGWAIERAVDEELEKRRLVPDKDTCVHHHAHHRQRNSKDSDEKARSWTWFPSMRDIKTHYIRDIGFVASASQMIGATIFWISGFTGLPNVLDQENIGLMDGVYWTPQVIGGMGFIISSILFMLETQKKWYLPAPRMLGWHIGFWNLVGAIGFTLCGALGYSQNDAVLYQSALATFWGSWGFLIASLIQWYEAVSKYPVEK